MLLPIGILFIFLKKIYYTIDYTFICYLQVNN